MSYTKAAPKGLLIAEAVEDSLSPRIATYLIHIKTGTGEQVASSKEWPTGRAYHLRRQDDSTQGQTRRQRDTMKTPLKICL
jgi:hypothetical protein